MIALAGYRRFRENRLPEIKDQLEWLREGQSPDILFLTCSDSRICPNELTDTDYGELFVIRNAGNSLPPADEAEGDADAATLEYAVKVLGVKEIVVCGHTHCGAIKACNEGPKAELPLVSSYVKRLGQSTTPEENVQKQIENIRSYKFVTEAEKAGLLKIFGWVYQIETGDIVQVKA